MENARQIRPLIGILDKLNAISRNDEKYEYYFRGHADLNYDLLPGIYRTSAWGTNELGEVTEFRFIENEDKIFREIIIRTPNDFINELSAIEKLVKMQHYNIPTRLLDITSNPLVALYFACQENESKNPGELIVFQIPKVLIKFYDSDNVSILANIAKIHYSFEVDAKFLIKDSSLNTVAYNNPKSNDGRVHDLNTIKNERPQFAMNPFHFNKVLPVKVQLSNNRIIRQNGAFLLFGFNGKKKVPAQVDSDWIINRIQITNDDRKSIRQDLILLGIDQSTLFPEIEKQADVVKDIYRYGRSKPSK